MMSKGLALKLSLLGAVCSLQITAMTQTANVIATAAATVETSAVPRLITYSANFKLEHAQSSLPGMTAGKSLNAFGSRSQQ
jgi:hypothetical protein